MRKSIVTVDMTHQRKKAAAPLSCHRFSPEQHNPGSTSEVKRRMSQEGGFPTRRVLTVLSAQTVIDILTFYPDMPVTA